MSNRSTKVVIMDFELDTPFDEALILLTFCGPTKVGADRYNHSGFSCGPLV